MPKPIVLVSTGRVLLPARGDDAQSIKVGADADYVSAIIRAGGVPLLLPPHGDRDGIWASVNAADGLLLTGGGDIHSLVYGHEPHPKSYDQDPARDATELLAVDFALKKNIPLLGVSRGMQVINVALGGTLIQHVPAQGDNVVKHESKGMAGLLLHSIVVQPQSLLHSLFGADGFAVNSFHHQAVDQLGRGLKATAHAKDGMIEAIESENGNDILGVQFHPEEVATTYPQFDVIFEWLVRRARSHGA